MGAHHQVVLAGLDHQVVHRCGGQIAQALPVCATVERSVQAVIGTYIENIGVGRIFQYDIDRFHGQVACQGVPSLTVVLTHQHAGAEVVPAVAVEGDVQSPFLVSAPHHAGHPALGLAVVHLVPSGAAIARNVHQSIVRACGQHPKSEGAFGNRGQGAVAHIAGFATACQVIGHGFPGGALVKRTVQLVGAHVQDVRVVRAELNGRLPVPA